MNSLSLNVILTFLKRKKKWLKNRDVATLRVYLAENCAQFERQRVNIHPRQEPFPNHSLCFIWHIFSAGVFACFSLAFKLTEKLLSDFSFETKSEFSLEKKTIFKSSIALLHVQSSFLWITCAQKILHLEKQSKIILFNNLADSCVKSY